MNRKNPDPQFWSGKRIFLTGHTGFKGAWLSMLLSHLGAEVYGYALEPPTDPSLYALCRLDEKVHSTIGDISDKGKLATAMAEAAPCIVIHMAAQPLVRLSYADPAYTYQTNVMGTVNLFEAVRITPSVKVVVNVTTDKCYENREWLWPYRECDPLGGYDPYSSSKACSEIVTAAYRSSYFNPGHYAKHGVAVASARAGNVIGGGDWATDRLIPDFIRAIMAGESIVLRSPDAIRPWQHVLEPLTGYLLLAERLHCDGSLYAEAWNFGPDDADARDVKWIVERLCNKWGEGAGYELDCTPQPHEATYLKLDCSKAKTMLQWQPRWNLEKTLDSICSFTKTYRANGNLMAVCLSQINEFLITK